MRHDGVDNVAAVSDVAAGVAAVVVVVEAIMMMRTGCLLSDNVMLAVSDAVWVPPTWADGATVVRVYRIHIHMSVNSYGGMMGGSGSVLEMVYKDFIFFFYITKL